MQSLTPPPICSLFGRLIAGRWPVLLGGSLFLSACGSMRMLEGPIEPNQPDPLRTGLTSPTSVGPAAPVEPIDPLNPAGAVHPVADALGSIARLEAGRTTGGGYLQTLLRHPDPVVRERATRALGRLPKERFGRNVSGPLQVALKDLEPSVRQAAAFALGVRGERSVSEALLEAIDDEDASVRAQIYLAMGRLGAPDLAPALWRALSDPDRRAQAAAAQAWSTWPADEEPVVDPDAPGWEPVRLALAERSVQGPEAVRWRALFTYARRKELRQDPSPLLAAADREGATTWERLFATLGLARWLRDHQEHLGQPQDEKPQAFAEHEPKVALALAQRCADEDERIVVEALRGFAVVDRGLPPALQARVLQHDSPHVRAAGVLALGTQNAGSEPAEMMGHDASSMVRRAAFEMYIRRQPADAIMTVREWGRSRDARQRRAAAQVLRYMGTEEARSVLLGLTEDRHPQVAVEAIGQLQHFQDDTTRARLHSLCAHEDNGRKLAAVSTLEEFELHSKDLPPLVEAYASAHGDIGVEVCAQALRTAQAIEGSEATEFLKAGLLHGDPYVMQIAEDALLERGAEIPLSESPALAGPDELAPLRDPDLPNPKVAVETNRGTMVFELYPAVAPVHVHNLLALAERGHYDGLRWHRVVSDFVIQGGCYRGDGSGGGTWRGLSDSLGQEFTELSYAEGALGMPRNENPDSGGSQIFVTHRPTPHLDGRYTLFGLLTAGRDVLHRVEEGDRILSIKRLQ